MAKSERVCVTGAAGFIGGWLVRDLKQRGHWVRGVDYVEPRYGDVPCDEGLWDHDLRKFYYAFRAVENVDWVFHCAATMGGMGYISSNHFEMLTDNALININIARAAKSLELKRLLFTSSACVYPENLQMSDEVPLLKEDDIWRGKMDTAYGLEKGYAEEVFLQLAEETDVEVRIARFHNIYGSCGSWNDGREKLPAAACRKTVLAKLALEKGEGPTVEIWGDGKAVRSFCYIDDCCEMLYRLMLSDYGQPMNIGTDRATTVDEVFDIVAEIAGVEIVKDHIPGPVGVKSRNADLTLARRVLKYEPQVTFEDGMAKTYAWIEDQVRGG